MISATSASPSGSSLPAAASRHTQFFTKIKRRKSHLPDLPKLLHSGAFAPLPVFLFYIFFFPCRHKEGRDLFFALCPPKAYSVLHIFLLLSFPLLFFPLLLSSPPFNWCFPGSWVLSLAVYLGVRGPTPLPLMFSSKVLGSLSWLFSSEVFWSFPWLFYFLFCLRHSSSYNAIVFFIHSRPSW